MREIKFRAWDEMTKSIYSHETMCKDDWKYASLNNPIEGIILMQYTGLKDKNGKEIYEGDILAVSGFDGTCDVKWDEKRLGWSPYINHKDTVFEIIGNVYENPDLLTPKE